MYDYVKQYRWARIKVGLVVTAALATTFLAVMFAGNIEDFLAPKVKVFAMVDDVKGLREGSPVWFSGVEIGAVTSIEFTIQQKVHVGMSIASDSLQYLRKDSTANIMTLGLLGDKYVELTHGSSTAEGLAAGETISGMTQIEIQDVVQTSKASISKISDFVGMLEEIIVRIEKGEGTVSRLLQDPALYDNLQGTLGELKELIRKTEAGRGTMGRLLNDDSLYRDLSSSATDIQLFARSLKDSEGTLSKLIDDPSLYERFQKASASLDTFTERLASARGTVHKMIEDESLYDNANAASEKLNRILEGIDKGEGLAGSLVKDDELSRELKSTLKELNALIKDIKDNPNDYFKFSIF